MKVVINDCYGGMQLTDDMRKTLDLETSFPTDVELRRNDPKFVQIVEDYINSGNNTSDYTHYKIVEIPDKATDFAIEEYDGLESVIYVVDGKLFWTN